MTTRPDVLGLDDARRRAPERAELALLAVQDAALPSAEESAHVVVAGCGTAAVAARVVEAVAATCATVPVCAVTDGVLPAWVGASSAVLVVDHGERVEAMRALVDDARARHATVLALGAPGPVLAHAAAAGATVVELDTGTTVARAALAALCTAPLVALDRLGFLPGIEPQLDDAIRRLHRRRDALAASPGEAAALARRIGRTIPLVIGEGPIGAVAASWWKLRANADAKIPAFASAMPEAAHDEASGWGQHGDVTRQVLTAVLLRHAAAPAAAAAALDAYVPLLEESCASVETVMAAGDGALAQLFDLLHLGDAVFAELAWREGLDPGPAPALGSLV